MFTLINSINLPTFLILVVCAIIACLIGWAQLKHQKSEWKNWKWGYFSCIILFVILGIYRVIQEKSFNPFVKEINFWIIAIVGLIFFVTYMAIFIILLIRNKNRK